MKLTKGMKKSLSLLLAGAMVITGATVTPSAANAEEATADAVKTNITKLAYDFTISGVKEESELKFAITTADSWDNIEKTVELGKDGDYKVEFELDNATGLRNLGYFTGSEGLSVALKDVVVNDTYTMTTVADYSALNPADSKKNGMANIWNPEGTAEKVAVTADGSAYLAGSASAITLMAAAAATEAPAESEIPDVSEAPAETTAPAAETTAPAETEKPAKGMTKPEEKDLVGTAQFDMQANNWCKNEDGQWIKAEINGSGTYTVTNIFDEIQDDPQAYAGIIIPALDAYAAYIDIQDVTVWFDGKVVNIPVIRGGDGDCRLQLWNDWGEDPADEDIPAEFREIKVQFTLSISDTPLDWETTAKDPANVRMKAAENYVPSWEAAETTAPATTTAPASTTAAAATKAPVSSPAITAPVVTKAPVSGGALSGKAVSGTFKITKSVKNVVVKAGKSKNVKIAVSGAAVSGMTAKSANKKVAKVKVTKTGIKVTAPKKATKGKKTTITLKNANTKTAKINVYVQNTAKKIKATKKSITIKKGKTKKYTVKVTKAENKKKAVTDAVAGKVKVTGKNVKFVKATAKKGKVVISIKGKKKGTKKVTIKVGSKKIKVKVKVK